MKKLYPIYICLLLVIGIHSTIFGQDNSCIANRLSFKLSASMNYLNHFTSYSKDEPHPHMKPIAALNVRSGVEWKLKRNFSLSSSLIFNQKGYEILTRGRGPLCLVGEYYTSEPTWHTDRFYYMGLLVSAKYYALQIGRFNLFVEGGASYNVGLDDFEGMKKGVFDVFASAGSEIKLCKRSFLILSPTFITGLENYLKEDAFSYAKPYRPYSIGLEIGFRKTLR